MLAYSLTAFILFAAQQTPRAPCTLARPPVAAHWSAAIPPASTAEAPLRAVTDVPLPGSASRFDYQSLEPSERLFISHVGAGQLVVFDVRAGTVIGNLDGFPTVTGVPPVAGDVAAEVRPHVDGSVAAQRIERARHRPATVVPVVVPTSMFLASARRRPLRVTY